MGQAQSRNAPKRQPEHQEEEVKAKKKKLHPVGAGFQFHFMLSCCGVSCIGTEDHSSKSKHQNAADGTSSGTPVMNINIIPEVSPHKRWSRPQSHPSYRPRGPLASHGSSLWSVADRRDSPDCPLEWQLLPGVPSSTCSVDNRDTNGFFESETSSASHESDWARNISDFTSVTSSDEDSSWSSGSTSSSLDSVNTWHHYYL
ncbi:hypothetical protein DPEC_G00238130 [Dallia pectoralis]|uniref:Uncharacterized protein n=1 Tax=Dallia pectoralis TaxID=75939 RepID=A0ACC2FZ53_DALPE|nr:hypothetical protein DPEC_G00238130 [Dallia pectoralis]